jgi:hypothetical protein
LFFNIIPELFFDVGLAGRVGLADGVEEDLGGEGEILIIGDGVAPCKLFDEQD